MIFFSTQRFVPYSTIIEEASSCSRWEKNRDPQLDIAHRETVYSLKLKVSIKSPPWVLGDPVEEEAEGVWGPEVMEIIRQPKPPK